MAEMILVGGAGFIGRHATRALLDQGFDVHVLDRVPPPAILRDATTFDLVDLLVDDVEAAVGRRRADATVVVLVGSGDARTADPWHLALDNVFTTARLAPSLAGRRVVLVSSVEVYGNAPGPLTDDTPPELPWPDARLRAWVDRAQAFAALGPCPPYRVAELCRSLVEAEPGARWCYGLTKRAQELVVADAVGEDGGLTVLRLANVVGTGQERVVNRFVRRALTGRPLSVADRAARSFLPVGLIGTLLAADLPPGLFNVGSPPVHLADLALRVLSHLGSEAPVWIQPAVGPDPAPLGASRLDDLGLGVASVADWLGDMVDAIAEDDQPAFDPALPVIVPARPQRPDQVADRQQAALWTGAVKHGNRWSRTLTEELAGVLDLGPGRKLLLTTSGTDALRIGIGAMVGRAAAGAVALLPSFTFAATAEVLVQLGYRIRFVDVDDRTWTLDPDALHRTLAAEPEARLVLTVDTFGHPSRYAALRTVCDAHSVTLLADSAASLGAGADGRPIADQAVAHAFSMSFAKTLSAGGAGGALTLPEHVDVTDGHGWTRSTLMNEAHAIDALDQLRVLHRLVARRRMAAERYQEACAELDLGCQLVAANVRHSWVHFVVRVPGGTDRRDRMAAELGRLGVGTKVYFEPLHRHGFAHLHRTTTTDRLPVTDRLDQEVLAIPMSSELSGEQVERVAVALARALAAVDADQRHQPVLARHRTT